MLPCCQKRPNISVGRTSYWSKPRTLQFLYAVMSSNDPAEFFFFLHRLFKCQPCYKILHLLCPQCAKSLRNDLTRADSTCPQRGLTLNQGVSRIKCRRANDVAVAAVFKRRILPMQLSVRAIWFKLRFHSFVCCMWGVNRKEDSTCKQ